MSEFYVNPLTKIDGGEVFFSNGKYLLVTQPLSRKSGLYEIVVLSRAKQAGTEDDIIIKESKLSETVILKNRLAWRATRGLVTYECLGLYLGKIDENVLSLVRDSFLREEQQLNEVQAEYLNSLNLEKDIGWLSPEQYLEHLFLKAAHTYEIIRENEILHQLPFYPSELIEPAVLKISRQIVNGKKYYMPQAAAATTDFSIEINKFFLKERGCHNKVELEKNNKMYLRLSVVEGNIYVVYNFQKAVRVCDIRINNESLGGQKNNSIERGFVLIPEDLINTHNEILLKLDDEEFKYAFNTENDEE